MIIPPKPINLIDKQPYLLRTITLAIFVPKSVLLIFILFMFLRPKLYRILTLMMTLVK